MQQYRPSSFKLLPDVVKNILIICGLAFFAQVVLSDKFGFEVNSRFGLYLPESEHFRWWQYFTYIFMHGSTMHIFSNLFALWMFGNVLENLWGPKRFLIFFLVTGVGAALIHTAIGYYELSLLQNKVQALFNTPGADAFAVFIRENIPYQYFGGDYAAAIETVKEQWFKSGDSPEIIAGAQQLVNEYVQFKIDTPTVGASGAVFGVLLAFGMLFPNSLLYVFFAIPVKAKYFVIFYGAFELYAAIQNNPIDNVAHFAHLGGMLFGFILIKIWSKNRKTFF